MEILKLFLDLVKASIWPAVVVWVIWYFNRELRDLLERIEEVGTPWGPVKLGDRERKVAEDIKNQAGPEPRAGFTQGSKKPVRISNIQRGLEFEDKVLSALRSSSLLSKTFYIKGGMSLRPSKRNVVFDAFATTGSMDYIIEVKGSNHPNVIEHGKRQLMGYIEEYANTLLALHGAVRNVKGILIVPDCEGDDFVGNSMAILKYDEESGNFTNEAVVARWISGAS